MAREQIDGLARALGAASVALGAPLLSQPGRIADTIGIGDNARHRLALVGVGARELLTAGALLAAPRRRWVWARVAGDVMDLALLASTLAVPPAARTAATFAERLPGPLGSRLNAPDLRNRRRIVSAIAAVAGITALDLYAAVRPGTGKGETSVELTASTTVIGSPEDVCAFWRDLQRLPEFMAHLDSVEQTGPTTSRWSASAPFGRTVSWEAEVAQEVPGHLIEWHSLEGADVANQGLIRFASAPGGRGTEVRVEIRYDIPGGPLGQALARFFGEDPRQQVDDDLRRFKQIFETGEVVRSDGAPGGKRARKEFPQRPAQPMTDAEYAEFVTTGDAR